jgi:hypothetical protein
MSKRISREDFLPKIRKRSPKEFKNPGLADDLRDGNDDVKDEALACLGNVALAVIRRHLDERLRRHCDHDDVLGLVWVSFFTRFGGGWHQKDWDALFLFVRRRARWTTFSVNGAYLGQKRNVRRELSLNSGPAEAVLDPHRDPLQVMPEETWESLLCGRSTQECTILEAVREQGSSAAAARHLGVSEDAVYRVLLKVKQTPSHSRLGSDKNAV